MGAELPLCMVVALSQNAVVFSGVKLSIRLFVSLVAGARPTLLL